MYLNTCIINKIVIQSDYNINNCNNIYIYMYIYIININNNIYNKYIIFLYVIKYVLYM